jgi:4-amino-4-deoxy-L-arabinose transferase-like glycosyltransferase
MKSYAALILIITITFLSSLVIIAFGNSIGYLITGACAIALAAFVISILFAWEDIKQVLSKNLNRYSIIMLFFIIIFFLLFSIFLLPKTDLVYFDENIYQGIALNILHNGNALMCWYGTPYVQKCFVNQLDFDPAGWPFLISVSFGLFGISNAVSHSLELFLGAISIIFVFMIASILNERKEFASICAVIFSLVPELFIWSNTLANPDVSFMTFTVLALLLFLIFMKKRNKKTLVPFVFCLIFMVYLRVEAILLVPFFFVVSPTFGDDRIIKTLIAEVKIAHKLFSETGILFLILTSILLVEPQIYTMLATTPELQANAAFYLYPNTPIFSSSYVLPNLSANISFLGGLLKNYPIVFLPNITILALLGALFLLLNRKNKSGLAILLLLLGLFFIYFIFYLFYFAGSVLVGGSVRFFLILYPPLSVLAAFGVLGLGDLIAGLIDKTRYPKRERLRCIICAALILLIFVVPFAYTAPLLINPTYNSYGFPLNNVTDKIQGLNPYTTQYAKNSEDFIQNNYKLVPPNCLVLSEIPSIWFMLNRSASSLPETDIFTNSSYDSYSCYYLDYDFWCTVSPSNTTSCKFYTTNYNLKLVATKSSGRNSNFSIYKILNYAPK